MTAYAILFTMAAIGISETVYLIRSRKANEKPICPIGGGCSTVLESKYNTIFGVHNDILGLLFYIGATVLTSLIVVEVGQGEFHELIDTILTVMIFGAAGMSLIFTYLQARVIKAWCFWCLMSALTVLIMLITVLSDGVVLQMFYD